MGYEADQQFGKRLRRFRKERGWSQDQFAAKLQLHGMDIGRSGVAKIEVGLRHVYIGELSAIREVLDISYNELLGGGE